MTTSGRIVYPLVALSVLVLISIPFIFKKADDTTTYSRVLMGTVVEITLGEDREDAAEAAFSEIARLEALLSGYIPTSDVSRIAAAAGVTGRGGRRGRGGVKVSPETFIVVKTAVRIAELSGGAFDPTVGALGKLWSFSGEENPVPSEEEVAALLPLVDYGKIFMDEASSTVGLEAEGMALTLGGVAKGFIVGRAVETLKDKGLEWGIVKAGGDMVAFRDGERGSGRGGRKKPFTIGIRHPRKGEGQEEKLLGTVTVPEGGATATSGDYERFFIKDGVRYHHILDPATGYPAKKCRSVTIISEDPIVADALSTAVFVMGPEKGMALIEKLEGVEGVIVGSNSELSVSSGLKEDFTPL
ncbi:MAG: FAD:protein FMN transferase [Thermodesulfobacteriota bacterium]